jgi:hypothetical protein
MHKSLLIILLIKTNLELDTVVQARLPDSKFTENFSSVFHHLQLAPLVHLTMLKQEILFPSIASLNFLPKINLSILNRFPGKSGFVADFTVV